MITKFIERIRNDQNPVIFGDGNQTRDFVYIEDVAEAVSDIMEKRSAIGEVFNIGTGRPTRIKDLAETIIRISNKELEPKFEQAQIGDIRERPLGYYMNILSHLRITKVQTRLMVPFLN